MPLKVISDKLPNPDHNKAETSAIYTLVSLFVGGKELLEEALKDGDITIHATENMALFGEEFKNEAAHWYSQQRQIRIYFAPDRSDERKLTRQIDQFAKGILFELCNATNAKFQPNNRPQPLMFPSKDAYAKYMKSVEFISYQKYARIMNATYKVNNIPETEHYKEYNDFEFYWSDEVNFPGSYGSTRTGVHAAVYRNVFIDAFNYTKSKIMSLPQTCPFSTPKGVSVLLDSQQMISEITLNLIIINSAVATLLFIKTVTCPQIQNLLEVNGLLSIQVEESKRLALILMKLLKTFPETLGSKETYELIKATLTTQSQHLEQALPSLVEALSRNSMFNSNQQGLAQVVELGVHPSIQHTPK